MRIETKMAFTLRATVATMLNIMFHYLSKLLITLFLLVPINLDHQWLCNIELHFLLTSNFLDYVYASNVQSIYIVSKPWYVAFELIHTMSDMYFSNVWNSAQYHISPFFWIKTKILFCICTIKHPPRCVLYFRGKSITSFQL